MDNSLENTNTQGEITGQNAEPEKDDPVKKMEESLGEMMQMNTPGLDLVEFVVALPFRILTSRIALLAAIQTLIPALAWKEALMYAGYAAASFLAAVGVELVKMLSKNKAESGIKSKLSDIFQKEDLMIYSYNRGGDIPLSLLARSHLAEGFDGAVTGDVISLSYRGRSLSCCNIALTQTPVDGFTDPYTQDDDLAREYFSVPDEKRVVFYGSVFIFFPGPAIKGNVRVAAYSPTAYLHDLQEMDLGSSMTGQEWLEQRMDSFRRYHFASGDNSGNESETAQVFTQRVKDMILKLEWQMRAPVTVYADQNIVCLTIQDRVYDFQCIHDKGDPDDQVASALYGKIASFKSILDHIIGQEGYEHTELLGAPMEQRRSDYTPFLYSIRDPKGPEDDDIERYVSDLAEWSADIYRFRLRYSQTYQKAGERLEYVSNKFLLAFLAEADPDRAKEWFESVSGRKLKDSLAEAVVRHFRYLWNVSGKCEVRNICRNEGRNTGDLPGEITFDIVVDPPIRKWEYLSESNRRMVSLCNPSRFSLDELNDADIRREFVDTFEKNLKSVIGPGYAEDHIYHAAITLDEGGKYGMKPEEINNFCQWYSGLMAADMEINGAAFNLDETDNETEKG